MTILEFLIAGGIPSAVMGFIVWYFKRSIELKDEKRREEEYRREEERKEAEKQRIEREKKVEKLMLYIMQTSRATNVLAEATAKAVQRIPDAHCNGDMHAALELANKIQNEEKDFIMDQGIQNIFES